VFRLSQDEYEGLKAACAERGAASISSFARSELLNALDRNQLSKVHEQLSVLQSAVQRMTQILEAAVVSSKESK